MFLSLPTRKDAGGGTNCFIHALGGSEQRIRVVRFGRDLGGVGRQWNRVLGRRWMCPVPGSVRGLEQSL